VNNYKKEKNNLIQLATEQQHNAANPNNSVWVEASAGTGKTKVLSDRVLRLLLAKVEPSKILCLTYTKAAAVEMSERITKRLSTWAVQSQND
jgi:ATP-dependent helicase/nuclease subunit A